MERKEYPVKYALLPVKELITPEFGNNFYSTIGYIVSKAYVLEKNKVRMNDGNYRTTYKVCFPHLVVDDRINYLRKDPSSDLRRDNEMAVGDLFDSFEEAQAVREERNSHTTTAIRKRLEEHESIVLELTEDLEVIPDESKLAAREQAISEALLKKYGITLEEFDELDIEDQHRLIELQTGKKLKGDLRLHVGGNLHLGYSTVTSVLPKPRQYTKINRGKKGTN